MFAEMVVDALLRRGNPYRFGDLFNVRIGGTPTVFVIDRQGQAVAEQVGGLPREVSSLCQE